MKIVFTNEKGQDIVGERIIEKEVPFGDFDSTNFIYVDGIRRLLLSNINGTKGYINLGDYWVMLEYECEIYPDGLEPILGASKFLYRKG